MASFVNNLSLFAEFPLETNDLCQLQQFYPTDHFLSPFKLALPLKTWLSMILCYQLQVTGLSRTSLSNLVI